MINKLSPFGKSEPHNANDHIKMFLFLLSFLHFNLLQRFPVLPFWTNFSIKLNKDKNKFKFSKSLIQKAIVPIYISI